MTPRQHYAPDHIGWKSSLVSAGRVESPNTAVVSSPGDHVPLGLSLSLLASSAPWLDKFSAPDPGHLQEFLPSFPHRCREEPSAVRERGEQSGEAGPVLQEEHQEAEGEEPTPGHGLLGGRVF